MIAVCGLDDKLNIAASRLSTEKLVFVAKDIGRINYRWGIAN
jgi:hypothetical protein